MIAYHWRVPKPKTKKKTARRLVAAPRSRTKAVGKTPAKTKAQKRKPEKRKQEKKPAPPRSVPRDLFLVWRMPRIGVRNPHPMTNASWAWLAQHPEMSGWQANQLFDGPSSLGVGPCWCANRFGQSKTTLPDGRTIAIGGEHEDYYDPDFYIYNDVIVTKPDGSVEIHGYPYDVFPPTDFHSATLVGERILVIGCLGHPRQRVVGHTPVYALDTKTLAISRVETTGDAPGWLFKHEATLSDDGTTITVRGGERLVATVDREELCESFDDWSLDVASLRWTRLTDRRFQQWVLAREDGKTSQLFTIESIRWHVEGNTPWDRKQLAYLRGNLGWDPDLALHATRYSPPVPHEPLTRAPDAPSGAEIMVNGVKVRYVEEVSCVRVVICGALPDATVNALIHDVRTKLAALERVPFTAIRAGA